jgi:hypothetical protein
MFTTALTFFVPKKGSPIGDWEDRVRVSTGDPASRRNPRFAMVDGATEAYDAKAWADCLVDSFVRPDRHQPRVDREGMVGWMGAVQNQWRTSRHRVTTLAAQRKAAEGSYATLLGGELVDLDGDRPQWHAVSVGDVVLFHVRDGMLLNHFPELRPEDFDNTPDLVHSRVEMFGVSSGGLRFSQGDLRVGDQLFVTTDALAEWLVRHCERQTWSTLDEVDHPATFHHLISVLRQNNEIRNDDVTLLRMWMIGSEPSEVLVCL